MVSDVNRVPESFCLFSFDSTFFSSLFVVRNRIISQKPKQTHSKGVNVKLSLELKKQGTKWRILLQ